MDDNKKDGKGLGSHFWGKWQRQPKGSEGAEYKSGDEMPVLNVYHPLQTDVVAKVILNGYNIDRAVSLGTLGGMRSFRIVAGDLWDAWNEQTAVILADDQGQKTLIRVAALPAEEDSFGLIEFVSLAK